MKFEVYCDESRPDLLGSRTPQADYMIIGGLWLPAELRDQYKTEIHELRDKHRIGGEFKWAKVSPSRMGFYFELIDWFIGKKESLRFRCIAVEHKNVNLMAFHSNDQELGFYKFYYQMLHHWILDYNEYSVFCDYKSNRIGNRLSELKNSLNNSNLTSEIVNVQSIRSRESVLIQTADVLTGIAAACTNKNLVDKSAKAGLVDRLETHLGREIGPTFRTEQKFNVFAINLAGGW